MSMDNVLFELTHEGQSQKLKHVENTSDRSSPRIEPGTQVHHWDKSAFLKEIEGGVPLKHIEESQDRSSPQVEGVQLHPNDRPALLEEVKAVGCHHAVVSELKAASKEGGVALAHVESPRDRSAPAVEGAQVGKWDKGAFLGEIEASKELKHVEEVKDRSSPMLDPTVQIRRNTHDELMADVKTSSPTALRHVEEVADRSNPQVTHTAALRVHAEKR